jgi:diguanylate cyclase (GGDEF)-like protein
VQLKNLTTEEVGFPLLADLLRDRFSDYLAYPLPLKGSHQIVITLATRRREGFQARQLRELYRLINPLTQVLEKTRHFGVGDWPSKDPLTGLISRRRFEEQLDTTISRGGLMEPPLGLLLLDLDGFSDYNKVFGHFCADDVLVAVSRLLSARYFSRAEALSRIGSDAFALLLPGIDHTQLQIVAAEVSQAIQGLRIVHPLSPGPFLGCSIGLATAFTRSGPAKAQARDLLQRAERALAQAKAMAGHQICMA